MGKVKNGFGKRSMRFSILSAFATLLIITVAVIVIFTYYQNTNTTLELSNDLLSQVTETVIEKTINYLYPASIMTEFSSRIANTGTVNLSGDDELENFTIEIIKSYPQLLSFNIGDENGNFLMPKKERKKGTIATKIINRNSDPATVIWKYRNTDGKITKTDVSYDVKYDPRIRPWYIGSKKNMEIYWTDVYIFFTDQVPGITAAYPVVDKNNRFWGVFSIDIELGKISKFLESLKIGKNGIAFIINKKDELVAYKDVKLLVKKVDDKYKPRLITETNISYIIDAFKKYKIEKENTEKKEDEVKFSFKSGNIKYIASFTPFPKNFGKDWTIAIVVPQDDFIGAIKKTNYITILISAGILLVSIIFAIFLSRRISKPIIALTDETKKIQEFNLEEKVNIKSSIKEIQLMSDSISSMKSGLRAFKKYVPAVLVRQLIKSGEEARLGGKKRELTIFFSDIANFTTVSEKIEPEELMIHLSEYLDELTKIIMRNNGTVDKYIGDAIMAFWNAPIENENHAVDACKSALQCQNKIKEMNERWENEGKLKLPTRIGLNTGDTIFGNMGSSERLNYSVIGDSVNTASRLEGVNKIYGTNIIISELTYKKVSEHFLTRPLDIVAVKGKEKGIRIYELIGEEKSNEFYKNRMFCNMFTKGFEAYLERKWEDAFKIFAKLYKNKPDDKPARLYINRCKMYYKNPPGNDWDGVFHLKTK